MKTFLLSYDPMPTSVRANQLLAFIQENRRIVTYYAPFLGAYVLKSNSSVFDLQQSFMGILDRSLFIIVEIPAGGAGGTLPVNMWPFVNGTSPSPGSNWLETLNLPPLSRPGNG